MKNRGTFYLQLASRRSVFKLGYRRPHLGVGLRILQRVDQISNCHVIYPIGQASSYTSRLPHSAKSRELLIEGDLHFSLNLLQRLHFSSARNLTMVMEHTSKPSALVEDNQMRLR